MLPREALMLPSYKESCATHAATCFSVSRSVLPARLPKVTASAHISFQDVARPLNRRYQGLQGVALETKRPAVVSRVGSYALCSETLLDILADLAGLPLPLPSCEPPLVLPVLPVPPTSNLVQSSCAPRWATGIFTG